ncbi:ParB/RepB/Spo0J family partition protein [Candidatus Nomurabacteria bacterium]|nr:ParB/RepB/Spo0J family partition protein [Candidatus Nomurabacteria bacterium]
MAKKVETSTVIQITSSYPVIDLSLIDRNPDQPRQDFDDDGDIDGLAQSISTQGLLQAPTVRHHPTSPGRYMIVAGERRIRAMRRVGIEKEQLKLIEGPGIQQSYLLSAIENLQRVNLNPIEEALTYRRLHDEEQMSWEAVSELVGRELTGVLAKVKLLTLPPEIQQMVREGKLPQVTALNLTQWRGEQGDYLRMAHDLVAGRNPVEVHMRLDTTHGEKLVQAKLPKTAGDYAVRIVRLAGHVQSMPAVLQAFLLLPEDERRKVFEAINPSVLGKLRVRFNALYRSMQAVTELIDAYTASKAGKVPVATPLKPPTPPPAADGVYSLELLRRALEAMFYSNPMALEPASNLSRNTLRRVLGLDSDPTPVAQAAINAARAYWRRPPTGREEEVKFIKVVSNFRADFGPSGSFDDALFNATRSDHSRDPVALK